MLGPPRLTTEAEILDDGAVALNVFAHEVVQQTATLSDQSDQ